MSVNNKSNLFGRFATTRSEEYDDILDEFLENYKNETKFEELAEIESRASIFESLFKYLDDPAHFSLHEKCLAVLRVLSRDKTDLDRVMTKERFGIILQNADLAKISDEDNAPNIDITMEAVKLLCNLLYNSPKVQRLMVETPCLSFVVDRINGYDENTPHDLKIFDIRILFLISALNVPVRNVIKRDLDGDTCLVKILKDISTSEPKENGLNKENVELACEILQVLFNLLLNIDNITDEEIQSYRNLVTILRELLLRECEEKELELHSNIVNLLVVIPYECYKNIAIPVTENEGRNVYENVDMSAVSVLLKFLDKKLDCQNNFVDNLSPIITALLRIVKVQRLIRKYIRLQVLPPLKDVMKRPEEGETTKAKLCQLLTSPVTEIRDIAAEFLFVLCKENVGRMIKYTGYGNAAGMFANKGLLGKNQPKTCYSSESEDSDTEEYTKYKEHINPVTGCYEGPKPDPLAGMTEEQKEYEALKLVGLVDQLTREGVVYPCRIGEDGRPKPIEHVLELQKELPKQQVTRQDSDSD